MTLNDNINTVKIDDIKTKLKDLGLESVVSVGKTGLLRKECLNIQLSNAYDNAEATKNVMSVLWDTIGRGTIAIKPLDGRQYSKSYLRIEYMPFTKMTYDETVQKSSWNHDIPHHVPRYGTPGCTPYNK